MFTLRVAFRNTLRQKRRTILTLLTMLGGFTLAAISIGWSDGSYNGIIDHFTRNRLGHMQIHRVGYLDRPSLYKTVDAPGRVGDALDALPLVQSWSPRVLSAGLASLGDKSAGVQILGIDPKRETESTRFDKKLTQGDVLSDEPNHEAMLGSGLARLLKADIGSDLVLVSQGADGSIANDVYTVVGLAESGDDMVDRSACYLHLRDAQELLVLGERVHEIAIILTSLRRMPAAMEAINASLPEELVAESWQEVAKPFYQAMMADMQGLWIMLGVIILIVAVQVLNTVLMSVLERTREYGVLKAVGTRPGQIIRLVIAEVTILALVSVALGIGVSLVANYLLSVHGITMPQAMTYGGVEFQTLYAEVNARSVYIPAITVLMSAVVVSVFPAVRAARTAPAKAMRTH